MPLEQRVIAPIGVGRGCVPMDSAGNLAINIPNELECVTNGTLANIVRQLSSLSRYAEDLFASILSDATVLIARSATLQTRIDRLASKVVSLDSSVEEVSLQDIHLRKAFKSNQQFDQQVVSRASIPASIEEVYSRCAPPPPLNKLNTYRDDGKDGLKFYTDPNYFFELWRQEMLDQTERVLADKVRKVPKKTTQDKKQRKVRAPNNSRERFRQLMTNQGEFIIETKNGGPPALYIEEPLAPREGRPNSLEVALNYGLHATDAKNSYYKYASDVIQLNQYNQHYDVSPNTPQQSTPTRRQQSITSRPSQPPPAPPSAPSSGPSTPSHTMSREEALVNQRSRVRETLPPPPPPPPTQEPNGQLESQKANIPCVEPPPPPPPPPSGLEAKERLSAHSKPTISDLQSIQLKKTPTTTKAPKTDARSDLLAAIREGIKLKRVEDCKQREVEKSTPLHDVASILARRVAIELSDSEGGADDDDDSDAWDDESEC